MMSEPHEEVRDYLYSRAKEKMIDINSIISNILSPITIIKNIPTAFDILKETQILMAGLDAFGDERVVEIGNEIDNIVTRLELFRK